MFIARSFLCAGWGASRTSLSLRRDGIPEETPRRERGRETDSLAKPNQLGGRWRQGVSGREIGMAAALPSEAPPSHTGRGLVTFWRIGTPRAGNAARLRGSSQPVRWRPGPDRRDQRQTTGAPAQTVGHAKLLLHRLDGSVRSSARSSSRPVARLFRCALQFCKRDNGRWR